MNINCPACSKSYAAPPESAGLSIRCGCGREFAVPNESRRADEFSWQRMNFSALPWSQMAPTSRVAFAVGLGGGALAVVAAVLWQLVAGAASRADGMGYFWAYYAEGKCSGDAMRTYYSALRGLIFLCDFGVVASAAALVASAISAKQQPAPPHAKIVVQAALIGLGAAAVAVLCFLRR